MAAPFTLWDLDAGNLVGAFDTEAAARAIVARAFADQGPASVEPLALVHEDAQGKLTTIAEGLALIHGNDQLEACGNEGALPSQVSSTS